MPRVYRATSANQPFGNVDTVGTRSGASVYGWGCARASGAIGLDAPFLAPLRTRSCAIGAEALTDLASKFTPSRGPKLDRAGARPYRLLNNHDLRSINRKGYCEDQYQPENDLLCKNVHSNECHAHPNDCNN